MNTLWPQHVLPEDLVFLQNKKVLVRVDWNMPVTDGVVTDTSRLDVTIPFLLALTQVAKVILVTHFGEKGESLSPVASLASTKLPSLTFTTSKNFDELRSASDSLNVGEVLLLENVRLFEGETDGSELLAKDLATLGEVFINNAFSVAHRKHASVTGIPRFLPSYFGPTFTHELENLSKALTPVQPALLIVGGAKISTKLALIKQYLDQGVQVFVGGAMVHNILKERGLEIGKSLYDETYKLPEGFATHPLLVTPSDVVLADGTTVEVTQVPADGVIVDCGKKTADEVAQIVAQANTVIANGPLGLYEKGWLHGTEMILTNLASSHVASYIGGGDTVSVANSLHLLDKFTFVSLGGGAMLDYLGSGTLPGIDAIAK